MLIKHPNGLYEDKGKYHHSIYKSVGGCVYRYSKFLDKFILCLDTEINKQIGEREYEHWEFTVKRYDRFTYRNIGYVAIIY